MLISTALFGFKQLALISLCVRIPIFHTYFIPIAIEPGPVSARQS
jgi:hypothetical protein